MKPIHVLYSPRAVAWQGHRVAEAFAACFTELGFPGVTCGTRMDRFDRTDTLFIISVSGAAQVNGRWPGTVCIHNSSEVYTKTVGRSWFNRLKKFGEQAGWNPQRVDWIFDYAPQNGPAFESRGFKRTFCPFTYHPSYDRPFSFQRSHDVGFIGMVRPGARRHQAIRMLERTGLDVYAEPRTNRKLTDIEVAEGQNSRVFLHVHAGVGDRINFPATRMVQLGIPCGVPAVLERTNWTPLPVDTYREFEINDHEGMLREVRWCLDNPIEARLMAARALSFLREHYQMLPAVKRSCEEAGLM